MSDKTFRVNLVDGSGDKYEFQVKTTTKLKKIIKAYKQKCSNDTSSLRYTFDGDRIDPDKTTGELGMEDGDQIDGMFSLSLDLLLTLLYSFTGADWRTLYGDIFTVVSNRISDNEMSDRR